MALEFKARFRTKDAARDINKFTKKAGSDVKKLKKTSVDSSTAMTKGFQGFMKILGPLGIGLGITAVLAGFKSIISETITFRDEIAKFSRATGTSVEFLSAIGFAAERSGANVDSLGKAFGRLARNISDAERGLITPRLAFDSLGISVVTASGGLKSIEEIIPEIADAFRGLTDDTKKAALAQELFGRSGIELIPLLDEGSAGIKKLTDEAERLGIVFDEKAAREAEAAADAILDFNTATKALGQDLAENFIPILTDVALGFVGIIKEVKTLNEKELPELVKQYGEVGFAINAVNINREQQEKNRKEALQEELKLLDEIKITIADLPALLPKPPDPGAPFINVPNEEMELLIPPMEDVISGLGEAATATEKWLANQEALNSKVGEVPPFIAKITAEQASAISMTRELANAFGQAVAFSDDLLLSVRNIAKQLAVRAFVAFVTSLLPGSGGFSKQFFGAAHGTNFAPGGPTLVGERGPEIVNLPRGSQVIPNDQISNSFSTKINFNITVREFDEFHVRTKILPLINKAVREGARNKASEII